jgi:putative ABC transport system permease protein
MRSYLAVLLRILQRDRMYAAINICGLSLGVACSLILGLFLRSELTYDRHNVQHTRIFRVAQEFTTSGHSSRYARSAQPLGPMLAADYPQIQAFVRFEKNSPDDGLPLHHGNTTFYWKNCYFVDDNVFQVFTHKILYGDPKTALKSPDSIAVSETFARKYFGNANPLGETITTDVGIPSRITLVFADLPANSHLKYDILYSNHVDFLRLPDEATARRQMLWNARDFTYLLMAPGFDPASWPRINDEFYRRYMADTGKNLNASWHSWLQPLADVQLGPELNLDEPTDNPLTIYACAAVALFILAVACINYMNLATARASRNTRSVGIRKILGVSRGSLALQFLGESVLFSLVALVIGVVLVELILRFTPINSLLGDQVVMDLRAEPQLVVWLLAFGVLMGVVSGLYPAFYLSSWAPLTALTARQGSSRGNPRLREALVLLQFTISAAVIATTLLMAAQMRYVAQKPLGFEKQNRIVVTLRGATAIRAIPTLRAELTQDSHILAVTEAQEVMGQSPDLYGVKIEAGPGPSGPMQVEQIPSMNVGADFVKVMGLTLVQGRDFTQRRLTDAGMICLVNEALVRKMGWTEPLGKRVSPIYNNTNGHVIGVVRDFNFKSLHTVVEPLILWPVDDTFAGVEPVYLAFQQRMLVLSITGTDIGRTLAHVEEVLRRIDPKHPFEYAFLDSSLDNLYRAELTLTKLIGAFAVVCILIACLGLFGLAAFTTEQRTREIGTRKVLGASTWQIIVLLARRTLLLVVVAGVLASIVAYLAVEQWLTGFAYRAAINPLTFVLSTAVAAGVAFATVAVQSLRAAQADPASTLRHV